MCCLDSRDPEVDTHVVLELSIRNCLNKETYQDNTQNKEYHQHGLYITRSEGEEVPWNLIKLESMRRIMNKQ